MDSQSEFMSILDALMAEYDRLFPEATPLERIDRKLSYSTTLISLTLIGCDVKQRVRA